jgi:hypothetical protein
MMAHIPAKSKWYITELIVEIRVEGEDRNVLHKNMLLIQADSPERAFERALEYGRTYDYQDKNPQNKVITSRFRGLASLDVIYEELEDGAEILYDERIGVSEDDILRLIVPKDKLAVFSSEPPGVPKDRPDYSSKEIMEQANELIRDPKE